MKTDLTKLILTGLLITLMHNFVLAKNAPDEGYDIKVKLSEFTKDSLFLGYQMGSQTYIKDTAILDKKTGFFNFHGSKKMQPGVYLIILPPDNNYFQLILSEKEQNVTISTSAADFYRPAKVTGSKDTQLFIDYMNYLSLKRKEAEDINSKRSLDSVATIKKLTLLDKEVKDYQNNLIAKNPNTVTGMLIKTAVEVEMPKFDNLKDKNEREMAQYLYYKKHYFDNFEMGNPALLRTPVLFQRIDAYIERLTPQHPDSIGESLDRIFECIKPSKETFQFYFIHYLNQYAQSKLVGFDAIYVNLTKKYIETGGADDFIEKVNREKIVTNANKLFPILIGKKAPSIKTFSEDNSMVDLYGVKSKYTVLFFFAPDCGHCQKQSPDLVAFLKKAKEKSIDVKVVTVCTYVGTDKTPECWKYGKEKGFDSFVNTADPYLISRYKTLYNIETTPQIFILDENKTIRSKSVEAKQVGEVLDFIIMEDAEKMRKVAKGQ